MLYSALAIAILYNVREKKRKNLEMEWGKVDVLGVGNGMRIKKIWGWGYMSIHKDIFHLEQFMYSYTFWIVNEIFYIYAGYLAMHRRRRRCRHRCCPESFINTIYILFYIFFSRPFFFLSCCIQFFILPTYLPWAAQVK